MSEDFYAGGPEGAQISAARIGASLLYPSGRDGGKTASHFRASPIGLGGKNGVRLRVWSFGLESCRRALTDLEVNVCRHIHLALINGGQRIRTKASEYAPFVTGNLRKSGYVTWKTNAIYTRYGLPPPSVDKSLFRGTFGFGTVPRFAGYAYVNGKRRRVLSQHWVERYKQDWQTHVNSEWSRCNSAPRTVLAVRVGFALPYAWRVHENMKAGTLKRNVRGMTVGGVGGPKYLSKALEEEAASIVADAKSYGAEALLKQRAVNAPHTPVTGSRLPSSDPFFADMEPETYVNERPISESERD